LITRNLSEKRTFDEFNKSEILGDQNKDSTIAKNIISEATYTIYKRFLIYGLQNVDIAQKLMKQMQHLLEQVRDFDIQSYELKLVIYKILLIQRDKTPY
jgi:hypothetical protein